MQDHAVRLIVQGALGRMGQAVCSLAQEDHRFYLLAGVDRHSGQTADGTPVYKGLDKTPENADVLIDFSSPQALADTLAWCRRAGTACVLCATGYTPAQQTDIHIAAQSFPVFQSANFSIGIHLLKKLLQTAVSYLPDYDVEIVETHHRNKLDAPSGTALILAQAVDDAAGQHPRTYGRGPGTSVRQASEVGIHAVRAGTLAGSHSVLLAGPYETLTLGHSAQSHQVFALGALNAAAFLAGQKAGYYTMEDLFA